MAEKLSKENYVYPVKKVDDFLGSGKVAPVGLGAVQVALLLLICVLPLLFGQLSRRFR